MTKQQIVSWEKVQESLTKLGAERIRHARKTLAVHLLRTGKILESWGCSRDVVIAGAFHAVYGTEGNFGVHLLTLDERTKLLAEVGVEAEEIVYLYSIAKRKTLYDDLESKDSHFIIDRFHKTRITVSQELKLKLVTLDVANTIEQIDSVPFLVRYLWKHLWKQQYFLASLFLPSGGKAAVTRLYK